MAEQNIRRNGRPSTGGKAGSGCIAAPDSPASGDVRSAIGHLRSNLHRVVPLAELAARAGVSERALRDHFQRFLGLSPTGYGLRLRLNAARQALRQPSNTDPVADIAARHGFQHLGRFSRQYRRAFDEAPSATRQAAAAGRYNPAGDVASPILRGDRPEILVVPFVAPPSLSDLARFLAQSVVNALADETTIVRPLPRSAPAGRREVTARYRIDGQLVAAGDRFRIVLSLTDVEAGIHLWGDAWSGWRAEPFSALERAVAGMAISVPLHIRRSEIDRARRMRPEAMDAFHLCLNAYTLLAANTPANGRHALDLLHGAIERDPDYGLAAALAAWGHAQRLQQMTSPSPAEDRAQAAALSARAGMLDPDSAMVLTARAVVHTVADDREEAGELIARALARDPRLAWAWERKGWLRAFSADATGAAACFARALRLDPASPTKTTLFCGISAGFFDRGLYDLSARWMRKALAVEPGATWINRTLPVAYARIGERQAAEESLAALRRYRPDIRVRDVTSAMHFPADFMSRIANGLSDLGLPP